MGLGCRDAQRLSEQPREDAESSYRHSEQTYQQGKLSEAQSEAQAGYRRFLSASPEWAGRFRLLEIKMMMARGSTRASLIELEKTPPQVFGTCELLARKEILKAFAHAQLGHKSQAQARVEAAEKQCEKPDPVLTADLAVTRGQLIDDPVEAAKDFRIALAITRQQQDRFREASALIDLAYRTLSVEHYDESIELIQQALKISKEMGYIRLEEQTEGNLAFAYEKLGDLDQAAVLYQQAEESARSIDAGGDRIKWRNNLGLVHEEKGQLALAEEEYREALAMALQQDDRERTTDALGELAMVSIRSGKWEQAETFSKQAVKSAQEDKNRPVELEGLLAQGLIASHHGDFVASEAMLSIVARDPGHDRKSALWEAQHLLAELYAKERRFALAESEYRLALATVRDARCSVHIRELRMPFFANATRVYDAYIDFLVQQGKIAEALKTADESRALTLAEGLGIEGKKCLAAEAVFSPPQLARRLKATILFYWLGPEHSYVWAISPDELKVYPLPTATEIETSVRSFEKDLVGSREVLALRNSKGSELYQTLVAPAKDSVRSARRVIVIADGSLSGLNFETLVVPQPAPHYWIEDVTLENASSLRLLFSRAPDRRSSTSGKLLLMGNALPQSDGKFGALPNAGEEIRRVGKHFSQADEHIYERADSTAVAYFGSHPEQFAYIHFVAHGTASLTDPLDSAVILSPSTPNGGYKLYARDVMTRPLKAELVTISTCKGAGVRAYTGEGLVGLSWAFLDAGAHHVIGALWDVSDTSTPQLMDAMYAELVKGSSPDIALRAAKLSLLHSGAPFDKPYYWAAFQLYTGS